MEVSDLRWLTGTNSSSRYHLVASGWAGGVTMWRDPALPSAPLLKLTVPPESSGGRPADVICSCVSDTFVATGTADGRVLIWFFSTPDRRISAASPKWSIRMPALPSDPDLTRIGAGGGGALPRGRGGAGRAPTGVLIWVGARRVLLAIGAGQISLMSVYSGEVTAAEISSVRSSPAPSMRRSLWVYGGVVLGSVVYGSHSVSYW